MSAVISDNGLRVSLMQKPILKIFYQLNTRKTTAGNIQPLIGLFVNYALNKIEVWLVETVSHKRQSILKQ
jgi:hypothetical protein